MGRFIVVFVGLFFACSQPAAVVPPTDILTLKEMSELATVEYTVTKIIKASDDKTWFKVGDRKILISCEATIKAGIDLSLLTKSDFTTTDTSIQINLPSPKVISISLPPEKIKVEYQQIGFFRAPFKTNERDELAAQAQKQIENSIAELGILEQAKASTSLLVGNFLKQAGFTLVSISYGVQNPKNVLE